ncbi:hypothetical protein [Rufibacter roseus]|uniref:Uncharacterized protein n=1 Tax=Rufibacter roseus TaxID=1567108 RepID=A0ABW2DG36_9BACT|nr:hypothetical protein [Rufibacter roseus]
MKLPYFLPILLLTISCGGNTTPSDTETSDVSATQAAAAVQQDAADRKNYSSHHQITQATKADFEKAAAKQTAGFSRQPADARKANGVLQLKINGKWQSMPAFKDTLLNTDNPEQQEFQYLGHHPAMNLYLVAGLYFEDYKTFLIHKATGQILAETWTEPIPSPDLKFLANISVPTHMEPAPNGVQVWRVVPKGKSITVEKHLQLEPKDWVPFELAWESAQSLIVKTMPRTQFDGLEGQPKEEEFSYLRLSIKE